MILLSVWAFAQPLLLYYFLYGQTLLDVAGYYLTKLQELTSVRMDNLFWVLGALILIKCILGSLIVYFGFSKHLINKKLQNLQESFHKKGVDLLSVTSRVSSGGEKRSPIVMAFKDLMRPVFLISLILTFLFFFFAEATSSQLIWSLLRPLALGFILFYLVRVLPLDRWVGEIRVARPESVFVQALDQAIQSIKSKRETSQTKENSA